MNVESRDIEQLKLSLQQVTSKYIEDQKNPSIFRRITKFVINIISRNDYDPDLERARNIQRIISAFESYSLPSKFEMMLMIIHGIYHTHSDLKQPIVTKTINTLGLLYYTHCSVRRNLFQFLQNTIVIRGVTMTSILPAVAVKFMRFSPNSEAINQLLSSPPSKSVLKGPFTFVSIWTLNKESLPAKLPRDLLKIIYTKCLSDLPNELINAASLDRVNIKKC